MEEYAARHKFYREWRRFPTGRKRERSIPVDKLEVHPEYPHYLDEYTAQDIRHAMRYILHEGAPPHRIYVMPNLKKQGYYYVIAWKKIFEAYKLLGIRSFIPTLCYLDTDGNKKLWRNWRNCPDQITDLQ